MTSLRWKTYRRHGWYFTTGPGLVKLLTKAEGSVIAIGPEGGFAPERLQPGVVEGLACSEFGTAGAACGNRSYRGGNTSRSRRVEGISLLASTSSRRCGLPQLFQHVPERSQPARCRTSCPVRRTQWEIRCPFACQGPRATALPTAPLIAANDSATSPKDSL